jgi:hypothetical protein
VYSASSSDDEEGDVAAMGGAASNARAGDAAPGDFADAAVRPAARANGLDELSARALAINALALSSVARDDVAATTGACDTAGRNSGSEGADNAFTNPPIEMEPWRFTRTVAAISLSRCVGPWRARWDRVVVVRGV